MKGINAKIRADRKAVTQKLSISALAEHELITAAIDKVSAWMYAADYGGR